jgi:hypothetical protein
MKQRIVIVFSALLLTGAIAGRVVFDIAFIRAVCQCKP